MLGTAAHVEERPVRLPLHLLPESELMKGVAVSKHCVYSDLRWQFDWREGQSKAIAAISWELPFFDGSKLSDDQHAVMLSWSRRLVLLHLNVSNAGKGVAKESGIGTFAVGLRRLLEWMVVKGLSEPRQLTPGVLESLLEDLVDLRRGGWQWDDAPENEAQEDEEQEDDVDVDVDEPTAEEVVASRMTWAPAFRVVRAVQHLWNFRDSLSALGFDSMPKIPWEGRSAKSIAKDAGGSDPTWIRPLPDEVAVPLINAAFTMLGQPAEDVFELQDSMYDAYFAEPGAHWRGPGTTSASRINRQRKVALGFEFSTLPSSTVAWHPQLAQFDRNDPNASAATRAVQLVKHVQAASGIVIQSTTGIRASELCALDAGIDESSGLPVCVEVERSQSGVYEVFILKGMMEKGRPHPTRERWLLGMRPIGATGLPISVQAILTVNKLHKRRRTSAGSSKLFLSMASGPGLPKQDKSISPMTTSTLNAHYRRFAADFVKWDELRSGDAPVIDGPSLDDWKESMGALLRSHQFRKTFASYVLSESPHLLAAVKRQFRHMNMALTDQGYWGSSHAQVEPFESVTRQETAYMIQAAVLGKSKLAGRMGLVLEKEIVAPLRASHAASTSKEVWRAALEASASLQVSAYHGRDGACIPLNLARMSCHAAANTRPLGNRLPNFETRTNLMCTGCKCFVIAAKHLPYWEEKHVVNEASCISAQAQGITQGFEQIKKRSAVALQIVKWLGGNVEALTRRIQEHLQRPPSA